MAVGGLLQGIDTVLLRVADYEQSRNWYSEKLGLPVVYEDSTMQLAVMDTFGPTSLTVWQSEGRLPDGSEATVWPIFRTPDASALRKELISRGIESGPLNSDGQVTWFRFFDPDGNVLEGCQVHE